ncbi:mitotic interactor and substrate of PLK1 [Rhynchocyon petersi]
MDRVTRYPIFGIPDSPRVTGQVSDEDTSYSFHLVGVGSEETDWGQDETPVWSIDHGVRLDTAKAGKSHSLRAIPGSLSSQPFYRNNKDKEMKADHLDDARDAFPGQPRDLERERQTVIQGQVVRKRGTVATLRGTPDQVGEAPGHTLSMPPEEQVVATEQIDFLAARQQFLSLERANTRPLQGTPHMPRITEVPKASDGPHLANGYGVPTRPQVEPVSLEAWKARNSPAVLSSRTVATTSGRPVVSLQPAQETPIEREIRLAQEREADLREQRGLQRAAGHQELVEIPTRPLLANVSLTVAPRRDRGRPSLYVQRDMVQEIQREENHRREGLQGVRPATPDWSSSDPQPALRRAFSSDSILDLVPDARAAEPAPEVRRISRIPPSAYEPYLSAGTAQPASSGGPAKPGGSSAGKVKAAVSPKATWSQRQGSEPSKPAGAKHGLLACPQGPPQASAGVVRREYFLLRPLRFRVPEVPQEAEVPQARGWEAAGAPAWRRHRSQSSELLEREVESVLRREREVAEERRSALFPEVFSPPPTDEGSEEDSRSSSRASGITGSYSVSESPFFKPVHLHSGLVWTVDTESPEALPDSASWQKTKGHQGYAGINPSDRVNLEVLDATRVIRHKNVMAERWEARLYNGECDD